MPSVVDDEGELESSSVAFFDVDSRDLASIFTTTLIKDDSVGLKEHYESQIRSLEIDMVTLMDEVDSLNAFKADAQKLEQSLTDENSKLKEEAKSMKMEIKELKDNVSNATIHEFSTHL